jgi:hypothetical protein
VIPKYDKKTEMLMQLHFNRLLEKDRRQYAAIEALKFERGGNTYISKLFGIDRGSVIDGIKELKNPAEQIPSDRQRRPGAGRKKNDKIS